MARRRPGSSHGPQNPRTRKTAEAEKNAGRQAAHLLPHRPRRGGPRRAAAAAVAAGRVAQDAAVAVGVTGAAAHLGLVGVQGGAPRRRAAIAASFATRAFFSVPRRLQSPPVAGTILSVQDLKEKEDRSAASMAWRWTYKVIRGVDGVGERQSHGAKSTRGRGERQREATRRWRWTDTETRRERHT